MTYFIMIRGPLGIGKSTIAKRLTRALRGTYLSMDKIVDKNRVTKKPAKDGMMDTRNFLKANEVMLPIVRELLSKGKFAITDGCFYRKEQIVDIINKLGEDKVLVFDLKAPLKVCIERDKNRKLTSSQINKILSEQSISLSKPIITQISRFDKWKDPEGVIKIFQDKNFNNTVIRANNENPFQLVMINALFAF